jgi:cell division protein ZapA (FtsZ GTPase activity inhibitor)
MTPPDGTSKLSPANAVKLSDLEKSTGLLNEQLTVLTTALSELRELRSQTERTHTQAELAVVTSLDATNEVSKLSPQINDLRRFGVTISELRRRSLWAAILSLVGILLLSYCVVSGQQVFSKFCQYPMYLTEQRADKCNMVFIGDRMYYPGPQFSNKNPGAAPNLTREETNNG